MVLKSLEPGKMSSAFSESCHDMFPLKDHENNSSKVGVKMVGFDASFGTKTRCLEENEEKHERKRKTQKEKENNRETPMASLRIT